jgi:hypothetical protein
MSNVIQLVKLLVSQETFENLKSELSSYEDWESVYDGIMKEIEEEEQALRQVEDIEKYEKQYGSDSGE